VATPRGGCGRVIIAATVRANSRRVGRIISYSRSSRYLAGAALAARTVSPPDTRCVVDTGFADRRSCRICRSISEPRCEAQRPSLDGPAGLTAHRVWAPLNARHLDVGCVAEQDRMLRICLSILLRVRGSCEGKGSSINCCPGGTGIVQVELALTVPMSRGAEQRRRGPNQLRVQSRSLQSGRYPDNCMMLRGYNHCLRIPPGSTKRHTAASSQVGPSSSFSVNEPRTVPDSEAHMRLVGPSVRAQHSRPC
jgi:hypothetical protein